MILIEGEYKKNDQLKNEVDTLKIERDLYKQKALVFESELKDQETLLKKQKNKTILTGVLTVVGGVGVGILTGAAIKK